MTLPLIRTRAWRAFIFALAAAGVATLSAQSVPERTLARWNPAEGSQSGETFSITDTITSLALTGPGTLVDDDRMPDGKAIEFTSTNAVRAQTPNNFKAPDGVAVSLTVRPSEGNTGANGCTVFCLYGHLEIRYRPDRKGYSLYVWGDDPTAPVQVFVPAPDLALSTLRAAVVGNRITFTVNNQTSEATGTMRPVVARVVVGSWPGRPFLGRVGTIVISEPTQ